MTRKNLVEIGQDVFSRSLEPIPPRWTTTKIADTYGLTEGQVQTVKRIAKREGARRGVPWAWHPQSGYFRCAPSNAPKITREMIEFGYSSWANAGRSMSDVIRGANGIGHVVPPTGLDALLRNSEIVSQIQRAAADITYTPPPV